jgi:hypothetical protein
VALFPVLLSAGIRVGAGFNHVVIYSHIAFSFKNCCDPRPPSLENGTNPRVSPDWLSLEIPSEGPFGFSFFDISAN